MADYATSEAKRTYQRDYYQRNREQIRERERQRYAGKTAEEKRQQARAYYQANREKVKQRTSAYRKANRDKAREWRRQRIARDPAGERERERRYHMKARHGLRPEDWAKLWNTQGGRCYLCGDQLDPENSRQIHLEHDHSCCAGITSCWVCRRGLACEDCNHAIGAGHDDPARLRRIADALEAAQAAVKERKAAATAEQLALTE